MERDLKFLGLGTAVRWFGTSMLYPFVGLYLRKVLGVDYAEIGLILLVIAAAPLAVAPFGGLIADRAGRRRVLVLSLAAETGGVLAIALSMWSGFFPGVILGGIIAGLAGNVESPASSAYVADFASGSDRTRAFSWIRIGFNVGFTAGIASGGVLIVFLGFAGTGFASALLLGSATVTLALLLSPSPYDLALSEHALSPQAAPSAHVSIRESARTLARDRTFLGVCLAFTFGSMVYSNWNTTFPLFVGGVLGIPTWVLGTALALNGAIVIFGQAPITQLMIGRRHTTSAVLASALLIGGFVVLGSLSLFPVTVILGIFSFVVVITIAENLGAIPFMTLPSNMAPEKEVGSYNGAFNLIAGLGGALAPSLGGLALSYISNPFIVWSLLALPAVPSILLFRWLGSRISPKANSV
jgi:MFS family permease